MKTNSKSMPMSYDPATGIYKIGELVLSENAINALTSYQDKMDETTSSASNFQATAFDILNDKFLREGFQDDDERLDITDFFGHVNNWAKIWVQLQRTCYNDDENLYRR
jgi:hypothetical protein